MSKAITYEEACNRIRNVNCEPLFPENEWFGSRKNKKILKYWFKDKNGHNFRRSYDSVVNGLKTLCNDCVSANQKEQQKLSKESYLNYLKDFEENKYIKILTPYCDYKNMRQLLKCECSICNGLFDENMYNIIKKDSHGCLKMPKGEMIAMSSFEEYGLDYKHQVYISKLNFTSDFEIKLKNGGLIHLEIDGDQHYDYPNEFHRSYEDFIASQKRDILKDEWYINKHKNNINIHIRYNVGGKKNDDISLILMDIIDGKYGDVQTKSINKYFNVLDEARKSNKNKKVLAYTLDGKFHSQYESILDAQSVLKVDNSCISECLNGKRNCKRANLYIFKLYCDDFPLQIEPYKRSSSKIVLIFKDNILIDEVESLNEVERKYGIHKSSLSRYLNNKMSNPSKDNYDFKFKKAI